MNALFFHCLTGFKRQALKWKKRLIALPQDVRFQTNVSWQKLLSTASFTSQLWCIVLPTLGVECCSLKVVLLKFFRTSPSGSLPFRDTAGSFTCHPTQDVFSWTQAGYDNQTVLLDAFLRGSSTFIRMPQFSQGVRRLLTVTGCIV